MALPAFADVTNSLPQNLAALPGRKASPMAFSGSDLDMNPDFPPLFGSLSPIAGRNTRKALLTPGPIGSLANHFANPVFESAIATSPSFGDRSGSDFSFQALPKLNKSSLRAPAVQNRPSETFSSDFSGCHGLPADCQATSDVRAPESQAGNVDTGIEQAPRKKRIAFHSSLLDAWCNEQQQCSLIGSCHGPRPPLEILKQWIRINWESKGKAKKVYSFCFHSRLIYIIMGTLVMEVYRKYFCKGAYHQRL